MSFYEFEEDDLFINTVQTYPQVKFYIQSGTVYYNNFPNLAGQNTTNHIGVPAGFISLYELNIDRPSNNIIGPFVIKDGLKNTFKTIPLGTYQTIAFGGQVFGSYRMSASIGRFYATPTSNSSSIKALQPTFDHYSYLSPHYQYTTSGSTHTVSYDSRFSWDKSQQNINVLTIPSIFYGSSIKKGTVKLKYYITGTLVGELTDFRENGDLVQTGPVGSTGSGSVAGSVLYNEGFITLTGSWDLHPQAIKYDLGATTTSKWIHFGYATHDTASVALTTLSSSFSIEFSGSSQFQTLTMLAHAKYQDLNHSNNPTFISSSDTLSVSTGSTRYVEQEKVIKKIVSSSFTDKPPAFEATTYLSTIGIYDKDKKLIGVAKMATPVRKTNADQYTFKLKLDI